MICSFSLTNQSSLRLPLKFTLLFIRIFMFFYILSLKKEKVPYQILHHFSKRRRLALSFLTNILSKNIEDKNSFFFV